MKRFNWLLIGLVVLCLTTVPLAGCVAKSEYEALQAELDGLQSDLTDLQADYGAASEELAEIKEVYPPRDFSSYSELSEWVSNHVKPEWTTADKDYGEALKIQEEAVRDGYIVSAVAADRTDYSTEWTVRVYTVYNTAIVDGTLYWWFPYESELWQHPITVYK